MDEYENTTQAVGSTFPSSCRLSNWCVISSSPIVFATLSSKASNVRRISDLGFLGTVGANSDGLSDELCGGYNNLDETYTSVVPLKAALFAGNYGGTFSSSDRSQSEGCQTGTDMK